MTAFRQAQWPLLRKTRNITGLKRGKTRKITGIGRDFSSVPLRCEIRYSPVFAKNKIIINANICKTMKKHSIIRALAVIAVILAAGMGAQAQDLDLLNAKREMIGRINSDGTVRDAKLIVVGKFNSDGSVRNAKLEQIGKIDADGTMRDVKLIVIGKTGDDGIVRDAKMSQIGKIEYDGTVRDAKMTQIGVGRGSNINKKWLAAVFFFHFKELTAAK